MINFKKRGSTCSRCRSVTWFTWNPAITNYSIHGVRRASPWLFPTASYLVLTCSRSPSHTTGDTFPQLSTYPLGNKMVIGAWSLFWICLGTEIHYPDCEQSYKKPYHTKLANNLCIPSSVLLPIPTSSSTLKTLVLSFQCQCISSFKQYLSIIYCSGCRNLSLIR